MMGNHRLKIGLRIYSDQSWFGGINYVLTLAKVLNRLPEHEKPLVYLVYNSGRNFFDKQGYEIAENNISLADKIIPFCETEKYKLDLLYPVANIFEIPYRTPWAGWIPDWQHEHMPEMFDDFERQRRFYHYRIMAKRAPFLVVSSKMAYDDTKHIAGSRIAEMGVLNFPAIAQDIDLSDVQDVLEHYHLPDKFYIICNKFWKHKNHIIALRALRKIKDQGIQIVFTGDTQDHRWPENYAYFDNYAKEHGLEEDIHLLGHIPRQHQSALMKAAVGVIQPSLFEGWSSVVEEAKALGKKLILSDFPVHREQADGTATFFEPHDPDRLSDLIAECWQTEKEVTQFPITNYDQYITDCARQLIYIAGQVKQNYDATYHSFGLIALKLLDKIYQNIQTDSNAPKVCQWTINKTVAKLQNIGEDAIQEFSRQCAEHTPQIYGNIKKDILDTVQKKHSAPQRKFISKLKRIHAMISGENLRKIFNR